MQNMSASGESDDSGVIPSLDIMFAVFSLCVGVSSIIMNFVVFAVYLKLDWKHPTYFLFINITLHDALSGFTGNCYMDFIRSHLIVTRFSARFKNIIFFIQYDYYNISKEIKPQCRS